MALTSATDSTPAIVSLMSSEIIMVSPKDAFVVFVNSGI